MSLLDLLFPEKCAFCGKLTETGKGICKSCEGRLPFTDGRDALRSIGKNHFPCAVAFYYDGVVKEGVRGYKFRGKSWRAKVFARYTAQAAAERLGGEFDAVTFVPVSWRRNYKRGYDQARLLAEETAKIWGEKAEATLRKTRDNRAQSSLSDPAERTRNVQGVYRACHPERVRGRRFLLIDDVCTTGSTLASAADALMEAGAERVVCAALAGGRQTHKEPAPEKL